MKFRLISDIHNEVRCATAWEIYKVPPSNDDINTILIIAGDYIKPKHKHIIPTLFNQLSQQFKHVIYVLGNHEYWKSSLVRAGSKLKDLTKQCSNVHILDQESITIDGIHIIGATLWTDMKKNCPIVTYDAGLYMRDYKAIRGGTINEPYKYKLNVQYTMVLHNKHRDYIKKQLQYANDNNLKKLVVTHHAPSWLSLDEKHKHDSLSGAYVSDLSELILDESPDVWCHGHLHNSSDYVIGDTRILCNPLGYPFEKVDCNEYFSFLL